MAMSSPENVITDYKSLPPLPIGQPELILMLQPGLEHVLSSSQQLISSKEDLTNIHGVLDRHGASMALLFGTTEERLRQPQLAAHGKRAFPATYAYEEDLSTFYRVHAKVDSLETIAAELRKDPQVRAAYVKPGGSPPVILAEKLLVKKEAVAPSTTPNFVERQGYLNPAPEGIDSIKYANYLVGGQGEGIRIVDCEWGWRFTHEDLLEYDGGLIAGTATTNEDFVNHGTAVTGILGGDVNAYGVTGICPRATIFTSSFWDQSTSTAIKAAADRLGPRDIILLEIHRSGPRATGNGQEGYIPIEWWPDDFAAIKYATSKGITVVEAAGNGGENLDDPIYDARPSYFPANWTNPFNPANPSSDAILVGAGAPPPGTHGVDYGPDRSRLWYSNYGARVDAQGWGYEVTTTGYGWLQGGPSADLWYTDGFSGTSSASPIVTGALACVQGILKDFDRRPLSPTESRSILRKTGSSQQDGYWGPVAQRIGNRPNIREMLQAALNR